jgi:hypothetical protein
MWVKIGTCFERPAGGDAQESIGFEVAGDPVLVDERLQVIDRAGHEPVGLHRPPPAEPRDHHGKAESEDGHGEARVPPTRPVPDHPSLQHSHAQ